MLKLITGKVEKYKLTVLTFWVALGTFSALYTIDNLKINTDTQDLLSENLDWRVEYDNLKSAFPQLSDNLAIIVESQVPESAQTLSENLVHEIANAPEYFSFVSNFQGNEFFRRNYFLYLAEEDLKDQFNKLSESQAFIGLLAESPNYETFLDVLLKSLPEIKSESSVFLNQFYRSTNRTIQANLGGETFPFSWQNLVEKNPKEVTRIIILTKPILDFQEILPAKNAIDHLDKILEALIEKNPQKVNVYVTGSAALNHDELLSVTKGASTVGLAAAVLVTIILYLGLNSGYLIIASLSSLLIGLACTAGFATLAIGTLNMISIAFAVLYVGLAIDFAIHLCLRYQEYCGTLVKSSAVKSTMLDLGRSITLCAFTTSIGFLAFIPTAYKGVAELGLISGVGMLISLVISLTLLPAILFLLPKPGPTAQKKGNALKTIDSGKLDKKILVLFVVLTVFAIGQTRNISFDNDPINLNDQSASSVKALKRLSKDNENPLTHLTVTRESIKEIEKIQRLLSDNPAVEKTVSILNLVPQRQETKLDLIEELDFILGGGLEVELIETSSPSKVLEKINSIIDKMQNNEPAFEESAIQLKNTLLQLKTVISNMEEEQSNLLIENIEKDTFIYFPRLTALLSSALEAKPFNVEDLPPQIKSFWSSNGLFRLEIHPSELSNRKADPQRFIQSVKSTVKSGITGVPIINLEASSSVLSAFLQALLTAIVIIFLVVFAVSRKLSASLLIVSPVCFSCLFAASLLALFDLPVNFANIIALPLLLGLGIDSSIHIYHRFSRTDTNFAFLESSTARAVVFSSLTTAASFGSLAVSPHNGTASLGLLLSIGLICILISALVLLPALIRRYA